MAGSKGSSRGWAKTRKSPGSHRVMLLSEIHVMNHLKAPDSRDTKSANWSLSVKRDRQRIHLFVDSRQNNHHYDNFSKHEKSVNVIKFKSLPRSKYEYCVPGTETYRLILFKIIIAAYRESHKKHINIICGQNTEISTLEQAVRIITTVFIILNIFWSAQMRLIYQI
jgi:hypothetical protein